MGDSKELLLDEFELETDVELVLESCKETSIYILECVLADISQSSDNLHYGGLVRRELAAINMNRRLLIRELDSIQHLFQNADERGRSDPKPNKQEDIILLIILRRGPIGSIYPKPWKPAKNI
jgi:hypothetical protein